VVVIVFLAFLKSILLVNLLLGAGEATHGLFARSAFGQLPCRPPVKTRRAVRSTTSTGVHRSPTISPGSLQGVGEPRASAGFSRRACA